MKSKLKNAYSTCMECGGTKMKKGGKWIKGAIKKPGSFTAQAKRAGMSTSSFRDKVLANKEKFSSTTVKRANLAKTLSKMSKGGLTNASMVSGSTKLPKKGQSFAKRKTTTPRFTLK